MQSNRFLVLLLMAVFSLSMFAASSAMAEPRDKVLICHYDDEYDYWKLLNINGNAVASHLAKHDDALPGGTTTQSGTALDAYCEPVVENFCGNCIDPEEGHGGLGCDNAECEAVVCAADPFCCDVAWDGICVGEALELCVGGGICVPGTVCD